MADLKGIIRFRKWELDEKRRELAVLLGERMQLEQAIEQLDQEVQAQSAVKHSDVSTITLGAYIEGARNKKSWMLDSLRKKDDEIESMQDVVSEAFRELKTFEIANGRQRARAQKEYTRQEQNELDELGLRAFEKTTAEG